MNDGSTVDDYEQLAIKYELFKPKIDIFEAEDWLRLTSSQEIWTDVIKLSIHKDALKEHFQTVDDVSIKDEYFQFGIQCLQCFVQANFTGPPVTLSVLEEETHKARRFSDYLSLNGEEINDNVKYSILLFTAQIIFENCKVNDVINAWWYHRSLLIHQHILDDVHPSIQEKANDLFEVLKKAPFEGQLKMQLYIEMAQLSLALRDISKSEELIGEASKMLELEHNLVGKLGKRTKFQQNDLAQLTLSVQFKDLFVRDAEENFVDVPRNLALDDEVRLNQIQLLHPETDDLCTLPNLAQQLLLAIVQQTFMATPTYALQAEEVLPYLSEVLKQKNTFCTRTVALLFRSKLEDSNKRTIERSFMQCEEILRCFKISNPHPLHRIMDVFTTSLPPIWKVKTVYADRLLNMGLIKDSLDVYLDIKLWEEVIVCYTLLKLRNKAAEVIKQQLEVKPTVKLMCLLGDATDDVTCYEEAWQKSQKRSYRAQRHWGSYLFKCKEYEDCIPHFKESLSINSLQPNVWLQLGFAALETKKWQMAAEAYQHFTYLEPKGFEAWNNLAQAHIKLGNKHKAHQFLVEALKYNFSNWMLWENFLVISADTAHYADVIRAYHNVLDLKKEYLNLEVLSHLIQKGASASSIILNSTQKLFGRLTSINQNCGPLWEMYADVAPSMEVRAQRLQRAYRGYNMEHEWHSDPVKCNNLLKVVDKFADAVLDPTVDAKNPVVSSAKLNLNSVVAVAKKLFWNETPKEVEVLTEKGEKIVEKIKSAGSLS